ncbi:uncharacterized protein LOC131153721 [Malania oleifera]|uniref:uncharacterized protein LOC131153721 n=1 Tax=Malania oleifera TaxID=397392 RepID=UPI0025ADBAF2|nr:uncharacterized protein LOC131153721 [Malania oleifera]
MNPPVFLEGVDTAAAKSWMQEIEKVLAVLQCTERQRVLFATYKLTREAERWWTAMKLMEKQMTMPIYTARFIEHSRFTSCVILDEVKKVRQFERGLRRGIYKQVVVLKIQDFAELVDRAALAEANERMDAEEQGRNKRSMPSGIQQGAR